jgi:uncharacterized membrane protein (Fun14 family)
MTPETFISQWAPFILNLLIALIVGFIAGKLLKTVLWLGILILIAYILVQIFWVTPSFIQPIEANIDPKNIIEWLQNTINYIKEHFADFIKTNSPMLVAFLIGFIISFIFGKK